VSAGRSAVTLVVEDADSEPHADGRPVKRDSPRTARVDHHDLAPGALIEHAIRRGEGQFADSGALVVETGVHTGRSPQDKFVVRHGDLADEIWWGSVNQPMAPDAFARFQDGELWLSSLHISPYEPGNRFNHDPLRPRKLLLHRREMRKLVGQVEQQGLTLVPLDIYFRRGIAKVTLALVRGKKLHDKRDDMRKREMQREMERAYKLS
jgi:SsrA-binding protein